MRTSLMSFFVAILVHATLHAQTVHRHALDDRIDSLQQRILKADADTGKVSIYLELMSNYFDRYTMRGGHSVDSIAFFKTVAACRSLSNALAYDYGKGSCLLYEASMYNVLRDLPMRQEKLEQAFSLFIAAKNKKGLARAYMTKAFCLKADQVVLKIRLYDTAMQLARECGDIKSEAKALRSMADLHYRQMEYEVALQQLLTVYALQKKSGDNKIHITTDLLAAIYLTTSKHKKALEFAIASIDYSRKTGDSLFIVNYYLRLGAIYFEMHNPEKAYYYFNKALSVMVHSKKNRAMAVSLLGGIVNCLIEQNKTKEAYDFFSRELKKYPAVDAYSTQQVNMSYLNLQYNLKQYKEAEKTLIKAIKPDTSYSFMLYDRMYVFTIGAGVYLQLKQYDKAGWYADSAYTMAKEVNSKSNLKDITFTLYKLELAKGNYPAALGYYENYKNYSDSIQQEIFDKRTIELGVKYETDQKNSQLQFLSIEATLHKNALKQGKVLRNFMIAASLLLLLLLLLIFNRYRVKQRANKLLQEKQDEINLQNQQLEKMVHEEKKITAEKDKLLQEKEWLMKEINHRVKNNLQVVMSLLNTQSAYLKDEAALNAIQESQHRVHAISLIHRKLYQSDRQLTTIDMAAYIKEVTDYLADSLDPQNRIRFGLFIEPIQLDVAQAVPTGLIINEAVTNAVKYAFSGGRTAQININMFKKANGMLELAIQDNGTGLPPGFNWRQTDSLGMNLMQGLCKQLDGEFDVLQQDGLTIKISFEPAKVLNQ